MENEDRNGRSAVLPGHSYPHSSSTPESQRKSLKRKRTSSPETPARKTSKLQNKDSDSENANELQPTEEEYTNNNGSAIASAKNDEYLGCSTPNGKHSFLFQSSCSHDESLITDLRMSPASTSVQEQTSKASLSLSELALPGDSQSLQNDEQLKGESDIPENDKKQLEEEIKVLKEKLCISKTANGNLRKEKQKCEEKVASLTQELERVNKEHEKSLAVLKEQLDEKTAELKRVQESGESFDQTRRRGQSKRRGHEKGTRTLQ